jgi:cell wall-associated NlpC family hydrolase
MRKAAIILFFIVLNFSGFAANNPGESASKSTTSNFTVTGISPDSVVHYATRFLGYKYKYAGRGNGGFDCAGLVHTVLAKFGINVPTSSRDIAQMLTNKIGLSNLCTGDLMFFKGHSLKSSVVGHVAMVYEVGENFVKIIHSTCSRGVIIENFSTSDYFTKRYLSAARIF